MPDAGETRARIREQAFACADISCKAAEDREWRVDLASSGMQAFIGLLCHHESALDGFSFNGYEIGTIQNEITTSKEWLKYLERLEAVARGEPPPLSRLLIKPPSLSIESAEVPRIIRSVDVDATSRGQRRKNAIQPVLDRLGMSANQWAEKAGVDPSVVYDYLSGKSNPRPVSRRSLAEALKLKAEDFPL